MWYIHVMEYHSARRETIPINMEQPKNHSFADQRE